MVGSFLMIFNAMQAMSRTLPAVYGLPRSLSSLSRGARLAPLAYFASRRPRRSVRASASLPCPSFGRAPLGARLCLRAVGSPLSLRSRSALPCVLGRRGPGCFALGSPSGPLRAPVFATFALFAAENREQLRATKPKPARRQRFGVFGVAFGGRQRPCSLRGRLRQQSAVHVIVGQAASCSLRGRLRQQAALRGLHHQQQPPKLRHNERHREPHNKQHREQHTQPPRHQRLSV